MDFYLARPGLGWTGLALLPLGHAPIHNHGESTQSLRGELCFSASNHQKHHAWEGALEPL